MSSIYFVSSRLNSREDFIAFSRRENSRSEKILLYILTT
jgi:hypothetical protein